MLNTFPAHLKHMTRTCMSSTVKGSVKCPGRLHVGCRLGLWAPLAHVWRALPQRPSSVSAAPTHALAAAAGLAEPSAAHEPIPEARFQGDASTTEPVSAAAHDAALESAAECRCSGMETHVGMNEVVSFPEACSGLIKLLMQPIFSFSVSMYTCIRGLLLSRTWGQAHSRP